MGLSHKQAQRAIDRRAEMAAAIHRLSSGRPAVVFNGGSYLFIAVRDEAHLATAARFDRELFASHPDHGGSTVAFNDVQKRRAEWLTSEREWYAGVKLGFPKSSWKSRGNLLHQIERDVLLEALRLTNGSQTAAGALLGIKGDSVRLKLIRRGVELRGSKERLRKTPKPPAPGSARGVAVRILYTVGGPMGREDFIAAMRREGWKGSMTSLRFAVAKLVRDRIVVEHRPPDNKRHWTLCHIDHTVVGRLKPALSGEVSGLSKSEVVGA